MEMLDPVTRLGVFLLGGGLLALIFLLLSIVANLLDRFIDVHYITISKNRITIRKKKPTI